MIRHMVRRTCLRSMGTLRLSGARMAQHRPHSRKRLVPRQLAFRPPHLAKAFGQIEMQRRIVAFQHFERQRRTCVVDARRMKNSACSDPIWRCLPTVGWIPRDRPGRVSPNCLNRESEAEMITRTAMGGCSRSRPAVVDGYKFSFYSYFKIDGAGLIDPSLSPPRTARGT